MDWKHIVILLVAFVAGYWVHSKMPGLLGKATGGIVAA